MSILDGMSLADIDEALEAPEPKSSANRYAVRPEEKAEAVEAVVNGFSYVSVAESYGVSPPSVRDWVAASGVEVPYRGRDRAIDQGLLECRLCARVLPVEEFYAYARGPFGYHDRCRACHRAGHHGLSFLQFEAMNSSGVCHLCAKPAEQIDHDHATGAVRGMLCRMCNVNLIPGYERLPAELRDSPRLNAYMVRDWRNWQDS